MFQRRDACFPELTDTGKSTTLSIMSHIYPANKKVCINPAQAQLHLMDSMREDMWSKNDNYPIAIQFFIFCYEKGYLDDPKEQIFDSEAIIPPTPQPGKS
jgi:hypothetical protein